MGNNYSKVPAKNNMEVSNVNNVGSENKVNDVSERPKLQSVVGSAPRKVKKGLFSRLITGLVGPEGVSGIGGYVTEEIIKPAFKSILVDAVTSGINMVVYGDRGAPGRTGYRGGDNRSRTNYQSAYQARPAERSYGREPSRQEPRPAANVISPSRYGVEEYVIEDRYDAAHVLTTLTECADRYNVVSVADYYDLIKATSNYTDNQYGWKYDAISTATLIPVRGGYIIKFPPVEVL